MDVVRGPALPVPPVSPIPSAAVSHSTLVLTSLFLLLLSRLVHQRWKQRSAPKSGKRCESLPMLSDRTNASILG